MSVRLSQLYGKEIYTERAEYIGKVEDVILNLETGEVMRLSLMSFRSQQLPSDDVKRILQEESVGYSDVISVGDIVLCKRHPSKDSRKPSRKH